MPFLVPSLIQLSAQPLTPIQHLYGRCDRGLASTAAVSGVFGERMDPAASTAARPGNRSGMELYELSAPLGRHDGRRARIGAAAGGNSDRRELIREIAELRETLERLRAAVVRWRDAYEESARRCAELEAKAPD